MDTDKSNIRVEQCGASGLEIHVPPEVTRVPRVAVTACLYAITFLAATAIWAWVMIVYRLPLIVRIVSYAALVPLVLVDFVLVVAAINSLLRRFRVNVGGEAIRITDYWLALRWQEIDIPIGNITKIEHRPTGSAGVKPHYSVLVHYRHDTTPREATLASAIPNEGEARRLAEAIRAALPSTHQP